MQFEDYTNDCLNIVSLYVGVKFTKNLAFPEGKNGVGEQGRVPQVVGMKAVN